MRCIPPPKSQSFPPTDFLLTLKSPGIPHRGYFFPAPVYQGLNQFGNPVEGDQRFE